VDELYIIFALHGLGHRRRIFILSVTKYHSVVFVVLTITLVVRDCGLVRIRYDLRLGLVVFCPEKRFDGHLTWILISLNIIFTLSLTKYQS
jgi:hypothetical protein